jgi:NAD(P)-dependent dehydrogenase (short-subunit alcohol dehydrogenase family)
VNHIAHVALVLRLVGSFGPGGGRVVLFSSDAHWPGKNGLEKYPPGLPEDLEMLVSPKPNAAKDKDGLGFQRYANSKLAITSYMYELNRRLEKVRRVQGSQKSIVVLRLTHPRIQP